MVRDRESARPEPRRRRRARGHRHRHALPRALHALAFAPAAAPARHPLRGQRGGGASVRLCQRRGDPRARGERPVPARPGPRAGEGAHPGDGGPAGRRLAAGRQLSDPHPRRPADQRAIDERARRYRERPGGARDPVRHHRPRRRRSRAAPLRDDALAPHRQQPRLHHAAGHGARALCDGQRLVLPAARLCAGRGDRPHLGRARPVARAEFANPDGAGAARRAAVRNAHRRGR